MKTSFLYHFNKKIRYNSAMQWEYRKYIIAFIGYKAIELRKNTSISTVQAINQAISNIKQEYVKNGLSLRSLNDTFKKLLKEPYEIELEASTEQQEASTFTFQDFVRKKIKFMIDN